MLAGDGKRKTSVVLGAVRLPGGVGPGPDAGVLPAGSPQPGGGLPSIKGRLVRGGHPGLRFYLSSRGLALARGFAGGGGRGSSRRFGPVDAYRPFLLHNSLRGCRGRHREVRGLRALVSFALSPGAGGGPGGSIVWFRRPGPFCVDSVGAGGHFGRLFTASQRVLSVARALVVGRVRGFGIFSVGPVENTASRHLETVPAFTARGFWPAALFQGGSLIWDRLRIFGAARPERRPGVQSASRRGGTVAADAADVDLPGHYHFERVADQLRGTGRPGRCGPAAVGFLWRSAGCGSRRVVVDFLRSLVLGGSGRAAFLVRGKPTTKSSAAGPDDLGGDPDAQ